MYKMYVNFAYITQKNTRDTNSLTVPFTHLAIEKHLCKKSYKK